MSEDLIKALDTLDGKIGEKFKSYETELKETGSVATGVKADLKKMADDFADLQKGLNGVKDSLTSIEQKGVKLDQGERKLSLGEQFIAGDSFKNYKEGRSNKASMQFKNTILGEAGSPANPVDTIAHYQSMPGIVGGAFRSLRVLDLIPRGLASSNTIHYTREASWTNAAAETREGAQKAEATLTFEAIDEPVRTIAHFIKVSKQVMDDAPALQSYIDQRLRHGVLNRAEAQIIAGNGTSPNLQGMSASGNFTALTVVTGDNDFDAINRAKYQVVSADYTPNLVLINPADWGRMERINTGVSGDARYVGADGVINYLNNGLQPMIWGLPVVASNNVTAGKFFALSTDALMFWERQGVMVEIFDQNEDDVEKNLLTIRAEMRGAFTVFRPAANIYGSLPNAS